MDIFGQRSRDPDWRRPILGNLDCLVPRWALHPCHGVLLPRDLVVNESGLILSLEDVGARHLIVDVELGSRGSSSWSRLRPIWVLGLQVHIVHLALRFGLLQMRGSRHNLL